MTCIVCIVLYALYYMNCILGIVVLTSYYIHCSCTLHYMYRFLFVVFYAILGYALYSIHGVLCSVLYAL